MLDAFPMFPADHERAPESGAWPFTEPPLRSAFVARTVKEGQAPIRHVVRDADVTWRFLDAADTGAASLTTATLREILSRDPSVGAVADLLPKWSATRTSLATECGSQSSMSAGRLTCSCCGRAANCPRYAKNPAAARRRARRYAARKGRE